MSQNFVKFLAQCAALHSKFASFYNKILRQILAPLISSSSPSVKIVHTNYVPMPKSLPYCVENKIVVRLFHLQKTRLFLV
jgi:hypothetical protein